MSKAHRHWRALLVTARSNMHIETYLIPGMMLGLEFVDHYEDDDMEAAKVLVVDFFVLRLMFFW